MTDSKSPENSNSPDSQEKEAIEKLKQWIEEKKVGSTESKAFCDLVDLYDREVRARIATKPESKSETESEISAIKETIRQRTNELPGYSSAIQQVREFVGKMEHKEAGKIEDELAPVYGREQGMIPDPKPRVSELLNSIKVNHIAPPIS